MNESCISTFFLCLATHITIIFDFFFQNVDSEPFEQSPFMPAVTKAVENDQDTLPYRQQRGQTDVDASFGLPKIEK